MLYNSTVSNDDLMLESGIVEYTGQPYDESNIDCMEAALTAVKEHEENMNSVKQHLGLSELAYYVENGEKVYTEADMGSIVQTVKRAFMKVVAKIKGLFVKFKAMMMKLFANDKTFVTKYKSQVIGKTVEYKGYKFTTDFNLESNVNSATSKAGSLTGSADAEDTKDSLRGAVAGSGSGLSASEFTKELFSKFRNGESSKESLTFKGDDQVSIIQSAQKLIDKAKKAYTGIVKNINKMISELTKASKAEIKKDDANSDNITTLNTKITAYKNIISYAQVANGALLSALKAERAQAKTICVKLISKKRESASEGAFIDSNLGSALSGIDLI